MKTYRQAVGNWGETLAADYLTGLGYILLNRNARTPYGEIDLIARQEVVGRGPFEAGASSSSIVTVFVEVKTRSSSAFGLPEESVTPRKQAHILAAAQSYLQTHPELTGDWRVDVISIQRSRSGQPPVIMHFENAITALL